MRILIVAWFCLGALGLGLVTLEASRRKMNVTGIWYFCAVLLGPIFLFFVLPLWLGQWGRTAAQLKEGEIKKESTFKGKDI